MWRTFGYLNVLEDQPAFGRLTSSSCGGLGDRRDPDTSDDSPRACGARLGLEIPLFPPQLGNGKFLGAWKLFNSYIYSHKKEHANRGVNKISQLVKILADVAAALMLWPSRLPSLKFAMKMLLLWSIAALSKREHFCSHQDPVENWTDFLYLLKVFQYLSKYINLDLFDEFYIFHLKIFLNELI